jgi:hypothetical protein
VRDETIAHLDSILGEDCRRELRATGEAMGTDEAIAYVLEHLETARASDKPPERR